MANLTADYASVLRMRTRSTALLHISFQGSCSKELLILRYSTSALRIQAVVSTDAILGHCPSSHTQELDLGQLHVGMRCFRRWKLSLLNLHGHHPPSAFALLHLLNRRETHGDGAETAAMITARAQGAPVVLQDTTF
jgi:hypothetical protein